MYEIRRDFRVISSITSVPTPAAAAAVTWNPSDKSADINLSNGNLTADMPDVSADVPNAVRSTGTAGSTQKVYAEHTCDRLSFRQEFGFGNSTAPLNVRIGDDAFPSNALGLSQTGDFLMNAGNGQPGLTGAFTTGDTVDVAWDIGNNKIWYRVNNGTWNSGTGGGDPAAGTGGFTTAINAGPYYAMMGLRKAQGTTRFARASWLHTCPTGFTGIDGS